jgi:hypothetical protein
MIKFAIPLILLVVLIILVRRNLLRIDHFFPLFAAIVMLGFAANSDFFIDSLAGGLGIKYAPLAIILLGLFILLALVTILAIVVTQLRQNQIALIRRLAQLELDSQELRRLDDPSGK